MNVGFHITRAAFWADNENDFIPVEDWLDQITADPDLTLSSQHGKYLAQWCHPSASEGAFLKWSQGNISAQLPDTALYQKMLRLAEQLNAKVMDDNGTIYRLPGEWQFTYDD